MEEGFIIQTPEKKYILAQGPFRRSSTARPFSLYRPDFFLKDKKVWIHPKQSLKLDSKQLYEFLFSIKEGGKNQKESSCSFQAGIDPSSVSFHSSQVNKNSFQTNPTESESLKQDSKEGKSYFDDFFSYSQKPNFISYQQCFIQVKELIKQKKLEKIVPVFPEVFFKTVSPLKFLQRLFKNTFFLEGYLYGVWDKHSGVLGFTPELLFQLQGDSFTTMALAGTALQNVSSLLKDPKQVKEHEFVVKGLKESLKGHINWKNEKRSEMDFPPLKHLRTDLKGTLVSSSLNLTNFFKKHNHLTQKNRLQSNLSQSHSIQINIDESYPNNSKQDNIKQIKLNQRNISQKNINQGSTNQTNINQANASQINTKQINPCQNHSNQTNIINSLLFESFCKLLHPSSAVGGFPKKSAQDWLEQDPSQKNRRFYAAPFGFYESNRKSFCLAALRNLQWNEKKSFIYSGAGWIAESSLQGEWQELALKRKQVKSFFTYCQKDFERVFSKA